MLNELLPKWYKPLTLSNLSEETFRKRITEIKRVVKSKNIEFLYDCLRIYLGKPIVKDSVITELKKVFGKSDSFFFQNDSSLELKVLSGAIIYDAIHSLPKKEEQYRLSLIISAATFLIPQNIINDEIITQTNKFIVTEGDLLRNRNLSKPDEIHIIAIQDVVDVAPAALATKFKEFASQINQERKQILLAIDAAYKTINILMEESNLLWWSFRSHDEELGNNTYNKYSFPYAIGMQLSNLIKTIPPAQVTWQFLKKSINEAKYETVNEKFIEFINNISDDLCTKFANSYDDKLTNLLPIHFALYKRKETGDNQAWALGFENKCLIKVDTEVSIFDFSKQFLIELLILKS